MILFIICLAGLAIIAGSLTPGQDPTACEIRDVCQGALGLVLSVAVGVGCVSYVMFVIFAEDFAR